MFEGYRLRMPVAVSIPELQFCDRVELGNSYGMGFFGDVFQVDWYNFTREHRLRINPAALKNIEKVTMRMGC
jgi:hypothetical protein